MPHWLKSLLLGVLVFLCCWGSAIAYWRITDRVPANWELAVYLLGLPLLLLLAFRFGQILFPRNGTALSTTQSSTPKPAETPPAQGLAILAASVRTPCGASPEELAAAIAANKAGPSLDPELLDDGGYPVMTARSNDAVDTDLQEEIARWLEQNGINTLNFKAEQWRALILATLVTRELVQIAAEDFRSQSLLRLQLVPILPDWSGDYRRAAAEWLRNTAATSGWTKADIYLDEELLEEADEAGAPFIFDRLAAGVLEQPSLAVVVACSSNIGEETVRKWAADKTLFSSSKTNGAIPGEGAAGLLLGQLSQAKAMESNVYVCLDEMNQGRLGISAQETKRVDPKLMSQLIDSALKRASAHDNDVVKIVTDADHRPNRVLELISCSSTRMPQIDGTEDVLKVGVATGCSGAVPFITALALARHHVLELQAPVLAVSNRDAYHRVAALVRPGGVGTPSSMHDAS